MVDERTSRRIGVDWWNVGFWIVQAFLAFMFLYAGLMKTTRSPEGLVELGWSWAATMPAGFIFVLGVMELLGALGIILPAATRILPWLTPLAAAGMVLVQIAAIILHGARGETAETIGLNLVLLAAALFVIWGRLRKRAVAGRV